ncbi:MAG: circadian clock protein KaiB [Candidatus Magnetoglobus multicellularis str. Araruama]|uniref:Circadian clock protein KaiB n=1 Tax=Candidatus Magnetoglobus multicellularis str. Araruama TaxID=890399 RepID=A0A1V1P1X7_9BACT|nr:MAG: circadian clock protein KaiB [Candidatus Magnetoglobus multicellularis str. Araruama]
MKKYVFKLYISGDDIINDKAINNLKSICNSYLKDAYELTIIDIDKRPDIAENVKIVAVPTLIKELPKPVQKFIGDISDKTDLQIELGLEAVSS